ncbi:Uncharacterised protein [Cedecea davisae]|uniref:Uncharacterized protein n=1 Tax=Cedecea davisae DSM 4568 TaxID=566551 RepID=S3IVX2_9ENTR|nr:hypothetical protein [Cedecea davisae]EPF16736.1 hypothetical protein HMPREF0201_02484 [Cedecea davisae DSM 4568]SUX39069.1 Uncharacterised protein [Cedecea davisae]
MTKYTDAAIKTVMRCQGSLTPDIKAEWREVIKELQAYDEVCPRCAFIGLCEEGMVKGIKPGRYGLRKNNKNKAYAIAAANMILSGQASDKKVIWRKITETEIQAHDQVNIVIALHNNGLLQDVPKTDL